MAKISEYSRYAPKCALPDCNNGVSYHKRFDKKAGGLGFKWKTVCDPHRGSLKHEVDNFKLSSGCVNKNGAEYGFPCGSTITHPAQVDINHKDGNHLNNDPSNIECLCRNCHARVTIEAGHHRNRYDYKIDFPEESPFEYVSS